MGESEFKINDDSGDEIWGPTMELRIYRPGFGFSSDNDRLQQKRVEQKTGKEEWVDVKIVSSL